jgi:hypothetical protein
VGDAFHQTAVAQEGVGVVIDDGVAGLVELGGQCLFGDGETDGIGDALAERAGGGFDARGVACLVIASKILVGGRRSGLAPSPGCVGCFIPSLSVRGP